MAQLATAQASNVGVNACVCIGAEVMATQVPSANICRHLARAAAEFPRQLAVAVQYASRSGIHYRELDFAALHQSSDAMAHALKAHGLSRGMKAVLMVTPSLDFFALTFALFKLGVIPILVDPGMGIKNLKQCFIEAAPQAFIGIPKAHIARRLFGWGRDSISLLLNVDGTEATDGAEGGKTATSRLSRGILRLVTGAPSLSSLRTKAADHQPFPMAQLGEDEMAAILFTSGSTGTPKGVVYSHGMFEAQIQALRHDYGIAPGERDLATFPLFSLFGPALGMASIVPQMDASKPITANPAYLFATIEKYQCSNIFVNPALLERLGRAGAASGVKLPSVKRVISAGAPATIASIARFSALLGEGVPVLNSYGATESLPISMIASDALIATTEVTDNGGGICVGRPIAGVDIGIIGISESVIEEWGDTLLLPPYEIGEIVVQGPMVSQGYYRREKATLAAKISDPGTGRMRHRMGDLGYLDDEGKLWMCGRKAHRVDATQEGEFCKRYFSIPCERIFNTHPGVKRSALVGVSIAGQLTPLVCIELESPCVMGKTALFKELTELAGKFDQTTGITRFLIHPDFPVDIRHNAKIFREKLALWAQKRV
jgi:olefin beta-lactone synthetase